MIYDVDKNYVETELADIQTDKEHQLLIHEEEDSYK